MRMCQARFCGREWVGPALAVVIMIGCAPLLWAQSEGEAAPFSWRPEVASVLDSGSLGLTSGPVFDPEGNRIGTFNSIWRLNADGVWKIDL